jgi:potassium efflux system protein
MNATTSHNTQRRLHAGWLLLSLLVVLTAVSVRAAPPIPTMPQEGVVSAEEIEAAIKAVEARDDLAKDVKAKIIDRLHQAQRYREAYLSNVATMERYVKARDAAPKETERLRKELEAPPKTEVTAKQLDISDRTPLVELEQRLAQEQANLTALETKLSEFDNGIQEQLARPNQARERLTEVRQSQDQLAAALDASPPPGEPEIQTQARKLAFKLQRKAQSAEVNTLDQELLSYNPRLELLKAQRDRTARSVANVSVVVKFLQGLVNERREAEAKKAEAEAAADKLHAAGKHPAIRALAEQNAELAQQVTELTSDLQRLTNARAAAENQAKQFEQSLQRIKQRVEIGGLTSSLGRVLIQEKRNLPQLSDLRSEMRKRKHRLAEIGLAQVRIEEERRELTSVGDKLDALMAGIEKTPIEGQDLRKERVEVEKLLRDRRDLLRQAAGTYSSYLNAVSDLDFAQQRMLQNAETYRSFLDERLLWIPTSAPLSIRSAQDLATAIAWFLRPDNWLSTVRTLLAEAWNSSGSTLLGILIVGVLFWLRRSLRTLINEIAKQVGKLSTDTIGLTVKAFAITLAIALPWPVAFLLTGLLLDNAVEAPPFAHAVGRGLMVVGPILYNLLAFREFCRPLGVGDKHFQWNKQGLALLRRDLRRVMLILVPSAFVAVVAFRGGEPQYADSLGRLGLMLIMMALAWFFWEVFHPQHGVPAPYLKDHPDGWFFRTRYLWFLGIVGAPVALVVLAGFGFSYTAATLSRQIIDSLWLLVGIIVVNDLVIRWLSLAQRKIAWKRALEKREAARAAREEKGEKAEVAAGEGEAPPVEPEELDLAVVDVQTRKLLHTVLFFSGAIGAFLIWADVFPALGVFDEVSVWSQTITVDGEQVVQPITLANLLIGLVILIVTLAAARNLPGVLEIGILQRTSLEPGSRYAITTLTRYTIFTIGLLLVLNTIGWQWSQVQWLIAALGVGLGFGLQEIVANFISGLIILFERPVRVGDTVTVGELSGTVSRIRIRATTITDWDRKEILVPNRSFITEQVINWTLTDPITRIVIPVGIAYGSDTVMAHRVMTDTIKKIPLVLDEPEPRVYFMGFGDSSLDFKLFVYVRGLTDRLPLMHEVHTQINRALEDAGITIPFPQRDLHVRSVDDRIFRQSSKARDGREEGQD